VSELTRYLAASSPEVSGIPVDLVVAADVFVYIGRVWQYR
jgi:predicted TPR repeat methyltransferase